MVRKKSKFDICSQFSYTATLHFFLKHRVAALSFSGLSCCIISQSLGLSLIHSTSPFLIWTVANKMTHLCSHRHTPIPWTNCLSLLYSSENCYRCINFYLSRIPSGDPRSTGPLLSFITMPMAVPATMVTCPPNTITHHSRLHEDKMQDLVWLTRAGLQNNLWSNETHNQIQCNLLCWIIDILSRF